MRTVRSSEPSRATELSPIDDLLDKLCARYEERARAKGAQGTARANANDKDYDTIMREGVPKGDRGPSS